MRFKMLTTIAVVSAVLLTSGCSGPGSSESKRTPSPESDYTVSVSSPSCQDLVLDVADAASELDIVTPSFSAAATKGDLAALSASATELSNSYSVFADSAEEISAVSAPGFSAASTAAATSARNVVDGLAALKTAIDAGQDVTTPAAAVVDQLTTASTDIVAMNTIAAGGMTSICG